MRYHEFYADMPEPEHPAERGHPGRIASLYAMKAEWADLTALCTAHGATLVGVQPLPIIPAVTVEMLCPSHSAVLPLMEAWLTFCETSPHRPRTEAEYTAFNARYKPFPDIPPDWTF